MSETWGNTEVDKMDKLARQYNVENEYPTVLDWERFEDRTVGNSEYPINVWYSIYPENWDGFADHWHEFYEFHYVLSGTLEVVFNNRRMILGPGDFAMVNNYEYHKGNLVNGALEVVAGLFDLERLSPEMGRSNPLFAPLIRQDAYIGEIMESIKQELEAEDFGFRLACKSELQRLLVYLSRNYCQQMRSAQENKVRAENLTRISVVTGYIQKHYSEDIDMKALAELLHISESRFNHLFKETIGVSPLRYINNFRLEKAKKLLETERWTAAEVAVKVGFTDYNHFGRQFLKTFGCTPNQARKNSKNV